MFVCEQQNSQQGASACVIHLCIFSRTPAQDRGGIPCNHHQQHRSATANTHTRYQRIISSRAGEVIRQTRTLAHARSPARTVPFSGSHGGRDTIGKWVHRTRTNQNTAAINTMVQRHRAVFAYRARARVYASVVEHELYNLWRIAALKVVPCRAE